MVRTRLAGFALFNIANWANKTILIIMINKWTKICFFKKSYFESYFLVWGSTKFSFWD